jgi:hypothetical protein
MEGGEGTAMVLPLQLLMVFPTEHLMGHPMACQCVEAEEGELSRGGSGPGTAMAVSRGTATCQGGKDAGQFTALCFNSLCRS